MLFPTPSPQGDPQPLPGAPPWHTLLSPTPRCLVVEWWRKEPGPSSRPEYKYLNCLQLGFSLLVYKMRLVAINIYHIPDKTNHLNPILQIRTLRLWRFRDCPKFVLMSYRTT